MRKILTIFERDEHFKVIDEINPKCRWVFNGIARAVEKLDGMNVRVTTRNRCCVRLEKRRNPTKLQKKVGILDPWYVDADAADPDDMYLFAALKGTPEMAEWPDGEWSCEALGPKIQGNPLELTNHRLFGFSVPGVVNDYQYFNITLSYRGLKEFFEDADSLYSPGHKPEGLVFHGPKGSMAKIKRKDF